MLYEDEFSLASKNKEKEKKKTRRKARLDLLSGFLTLTDLESITLFLKRWFAKFLAVKRNDLRGSLGEKLHYKRQLMSQFYMKANP
jgi:hypothetical protein